MTFHKQSRILDDDWYLKSYPDVATSGMSPLTHYQNFGKAEGRLPCENRAYDYEVSLWAGDRSFLVLLKSVITKKDSKEYEKGYAYWALARWYASQNDFSAAREFIDVLIKQPALLGVPVHLGPLLLSATVLMQCGETDAVLALLNTRNNSICDSEFNDVYLAYCSVLKLVNAPQKNSALKNLNEIFKQASLSSLALRQSNSLNLDNLIVEASIKTAAFTNEAALPLVSIVIPLYNAKHTLATAVKSLLVQTWQNLEIIIVDDASTDDSLNVANQLAANDDRIQVIEQHVNQGAYAARNLGLLAATGEYITTHDSDDYSHCQKIELQIQALINNPNIKASVSHWARCSSNLIFGSWRQETSWIHRNVSSLMFSRDVFDVLGYWDRVSINADTEYYYRILHAFGNKSIAEVKPGVPLAFGRTEANSLTQNPQTHLRTQFVGVRKDYMDAARQWHKDVPLTQLYLPFSPRVRPFDAPDLINRPGQYFTEHNWPTFEGALPSAKSDTAKNENHKTVLLCAHAAGKTLFGAERSFLDMAKAIHKLGFKLLITLPEQGSKEYINALQQYAYKIFIVPCLSWHTDRAIDVIAQKVFEQIIAEYHVDLVHVNTSVLKEPLLAAKYKGVPSLIHVRELPCLDPDLCIGLGANAKQIREHVVTNANGIIANSICTHGFIDKSQLTNLLYNTIDHNEFNVPLNIDKHHKNKICFALISSNLPKKGLFDFVELAKRCVLEVPNAQFILIGPQNEHIQTLITEDALPSNLQVAGYAQSPQAALAQAHVVLNLSHFQESFGRTISEAMAAARPVIAYRWGALPELIENNKTGYLVHLGDIEGLVTRVGNLTKDATRRHVMGLAGQARVINKFNFSEYSKTLNTIYKKYFS